MNGHVPREVVVRVEDLAALQARERLGLHRRSNARVGSGGRWGGDICPRRLFCATAAFSALKVYFRYRVSRWV